MNFGDEYMRMLSLRNLGGNFKMQRNDMGIIDYMPDFPPDEPEPLPTSEAQALGSLPTPSDVTALPKDFARIGDLLTAASKAYESVGQKTGQDVFDYVLKQTGNRDVAEATRKQIEGRINRAQFATDLFIPQTPEDVALMAAFGGPLSKVGRRVAGTIGGGIIGAGVSSANEPEADGE